MNSMFKALLFSILMFVAQLSQAEASLIDTTGKVTHLSDLKGKWVVVNYWAHWCEVCVKEIPELNRFYKNRKNNVVLFSVNYDTIHGKVSSAKHKRTIKMLKIQFPVLVKNPAKELHLGGLSVIPATFIVNPEGKVVRKLVGEQTAQSINKAIEKAKSKKRA